MNTIPTQHRSGIYGLVAVAIAAFGFIAFLVWQSNQDTPRRVRDAAEKATIDAELIQAKAARNELEVRDRQAADEWRALHTHSEDALRMANEVTARYGSFRTALSALLSNDNGKEIASDPNLVTVYQTLLSSDEALAGLHRAQAVLTSLRDRAAEQSHQTQGVATVPMEQKVSFQNEERCVRAAKDKVSTLERDLARLVSAAQADSLPPSRDKNLQQALREADIDRERLIIEAAAPRIRAEQKAVDDAKAEIMVANVKAEAAAERKQMEADFERRGKEREDYLKQVQFEKDAAHAIALSQVKAEAEKRLKAEEEVLIKAKREAEEQAARVRHAELVSECHSDSVKDALRPFLDHGSWQPTYDFKRHGGSQPMSFELLSAWGALNDSVGGLIALYNAGATRYDTVRFRWPLTDNIFRDGISECVKKAQVLLVRLGPTLVSEGLLAK